MLTSRLARDVRGASLVEYILLVAAIALAALLGLHAFSASVQSKAVADGRCVAALDAAGCTNASSTPGGSASSSSAGGPAPRQPRSVGRWAAGIGRGVALGALDFVTGTASLVAAATPVGIAYYAIANRPNPAVETILGVGKLALSVTPPGQMVAAAGGPDPAGDLVRAIGTSVSDAWKRDPAETIGRGAFYAASVVVPFAWGRSAVQAADVARAVDAARTIDTARAGEAAQLVADAARLGSAVEGVSASEAAQSAEAVTEAARTGQGLLGEFRPLPGGSTAYVRGNGTVALKRLRYWDGWNRDKIASDIVRLVKGPLNDSLARDGLEGVLPKMSLERGKIIATSELDPATAVEWKQLDPAARRVAYGEVKRVLASARAGMKDLPDVITTPYMAPEDLRAGKYFLDEAVDDFRFQADGRIAPGGWYDPIGCVIKPPPKPRLPRAAR